MRSGSIGRLLSAGLAAGAFSVVAYAQDPAGTPGQRADADRDRMVTVTGCLRAEKDVPGRDETLFQRWGLTEQDFVLTHVKPQQAAGSQTGQAGQAAAQDQQTAGTAGDAARPHATNMLKLEGKDADELRQHVNHRVEIRGEVEDRHWFERAFGGDHDRDRPATGTTAGTQTGQPTGTTGTPAGTAGDDDRLREIDIESIRALGPC